MRGSTEAATRRRASYQRSRTVDALPLQRLPHGAIEHRNSLDSQDETIAGEEALLLGSSAEGSPFHGSRGSGRLSRENLCRSSSRSPIVKTSFQYILSDCNLNNQHRITTTTVPPGSNVVVRKSSDNELYCSSTSARVLQRSPSSSSALLAKVKDRIVDTFFQTSSEGPQLAAIVQERRQRAAEEFTARLSAFRAQQPTTAPPPQQASRTSSLSSDPGSTDKVPGHRNRNVPAMDPGTTGDEIDSDALRFDRSRREGARAAFRRRSVSEDNCLPQSLLGRSRPVANGGTTMAVSQVGLEGIVCSSDDFLALASGLQHRYRPRLKCMGPRAMSFDQGRQLSRTTGNHWGSVLVGCESSQRKILEAFEEVADTNHTEVQPSPAVMVLEGGGSEVTPTADNDDDDGDKPAAGNHHHPGSGSFKRQPTMTDRGQLPLSPADKNLGPPTSCSRSPSGDDSQGPVSVVPVPEVEFDANGQTWGVYGAELDPEILGTAIQLHLSRLIASKKKKKSKKNQKRGSKSSGDEGPIWPLKQDTQQDTDDSEQEEGVGGTGEGEDHEQGREEHEDALSPPILAAGRRGEQTDKGCLHRYLCIFSGGGGDSSSGSNDT